MRTSITDVKGLLLFLAISIATKCRAMENTAADNIKTNKYNENTNLLVSLLECMADESKCGEVDALIKKRCKEVEENGCTDCHLNEQQNSRQQVDLTKESKPRSDIVFMKLFNKAGVLNQFLDRLTTGGLTKMTVSLV